MAAAVPNAGNLPPALNRPNRFPTNQPLNNDLTSGRYLIWYGWNNLINTNVPGIIPQFVLLKDNSEVGV